MRRGIFCLPLDERNSNPLPLGAIRFVQDPGRSAGPQTEKRPGLPPGVVIFSHERVGQGGRLFRCLKFRTMRPGADRLLEEHLAENEAARREYE
ncbi:MAG: sugar transferase, partial [Acidobacteriota bacterium]